MAKKEKHGQRIGEKLGKSVGLELATVDGQAVISYRTLSEVRGGPQKSQKLERTDGRARAKRKPRSRCLIAYSASGQREGANFVLLGPAIRRWKVTDAKITVSPFFLLLFTLFRVKIWTAKRLCLSTSAIVPIKRRIYKEINWLLDFCVGRKKFSKKGEKKFKCLFIKSEEIH